MEQQALREHSWLARGATDLPSRALIAFVVLTFAITWGIAGSYIYFPEPMASLFGEIEGAHPLYFLATWGPGVAGVIVVALHGGWRGVKAFLSRLFLWRCAPFWWFLVLVGTPLIFMAGSLIKGGPLLAPIGEGELGMFFAVALIMLFLGPVEEFGWRGVAQPLLQRHMAPLWAGALIGVVWGGWHLPAFYLAGVVHADWDFTTFFIGCMAIGVLVTPIFNATGGGLLLPVLFHWQLIIPFWPDAQPWDTWIIVALAAIIVWVRRDTMLGGAGAVTTVIPDRGSAG